MLKNTPIISKAIRFLSAAVIFHMLFYTKPHFSLGPLCTVMLLYVKDLLDTSPCYLLIVYCKQQRSCAVLVLVLTLLACTSCWLTTLHLVDNAGFVKKINKTF